MSNSTQKLEVLLLLLIGLSFIAASSPYIIGTLFIVLAANKVIDTTDADKEQ